MGSKIVKVPEGFEIYEANIVDRFTRGICHVTANLIKGKKLYCRFSDEMFYANLFYYRKRWHCHVYHYGICELVVIDEELECLIGGVFAITDTWI